MDRNNSDKNLQMVGWCDYCKDPIFADDEIIRRRDKIYHEFCWFQKTHYASPYEWEDRT